MNASIPWFLQGGGEAQACRGREERMMQTAPDASGVAHGLASRSEVRTGGRSPDFHTCCGGAGATLEAHGCRAGRGLARPRWWGVKLEGQGRRGKERVHEPAWGRWRREMMSHAFSVSFLHAGWFRCAWACVWATFVGGLRVHLAVLGLDGAERVTILEWIKQETHPRTRDIHEQEIYKANIS